MVDGRDAVEGEVSDSDQEFESIVEVDKLMRELSEIYAANIKDSESLAHFWERIAILLRKMHLIMDLLEYENVDLWRTFDEVVAHELFEINNLGLVVEMAKLAYEMELPYKSFWCALVNVVLLKHQEFPLFGHDDDRAGEGLIDLCFYIFKS